MSTASAHKVPATSRPRPKLRPNYPRSRNGCLTCRKRKKKCDEIRPLCQNCTRKDLECKWPARNAERKSNEEGPEIGAVSTSGHVAESPVQTAFLSAPAGNSEDTFREGDSLITHPESGVAVPSIPWNPMLGSFMGPDRACSMRPASMRFLEHYLARTGVMLAMVPPSKSPFMTTLVPTAYMDDLLMHVMLAVSGAHLSFNQPENEETTQATLSHYYSVIRNIRKEIGHSDLQNDPTKTVRLLLVLIMLCHYEVSQPVQHPHSSLNRNRFYQGTQPAIFFSISVLVVNSSSGSSQRVARLPMISLALPSSSIPTF